MVMRAQQASGARPELEGLALTDHVFFSTVWVLVAYEVVRTLHARLGTAAPPSLIATKETLGRVRVPLVKLEPAKRFRKTDLNWPDTLIHPQLGAAWQPTPGTVISRDDLSRLVRTTLQACRDLKPAAG